MANLFASLFDRLFPKRHISILMVGLDGAVKTTVLFKMKIGEVVTTIPTIGFNVETLEYKNISFTVWDIGGQQKIRPLWKCYYENSMAVIFLIDSNDRDRIEEARDELAEMIQSDQLRDKIFLIFANKQDLPNAMSVSEISDRLHLISSINKKWRIQPTIAVTGEGLYEGLDWLANELR